MTTLRILCITGVMSCWTAVAQPETELKVSGQARFRTEVGDFSFRPESPYGMSHYLRTRVAVEALVDSNARAIVQFQDSRLVGDNRTNASGTLNNAKNVDVHQGYLQIDKFFAQGVGLKAGRFEINLGNGRVFGNVDWNNVGRAWEGVEGWLTTSDLKLTLFGLLRLTSIPHYTDTYHDIFGIHMAEKRAGLETFAFYDRDRAGLGTGQGARRLHRLSVGAYWNRTVGHLDFLSNAVYQLGRRRQSISASSGSFVRERDISAALFTLETGYTLSDAAKTRLALGVDVASGDGDPNDNDWHAYDNLYYTSHAFRGYMDYFVGSDVTGLIDLMARGRTTPFTGWTFTGDVHYFRRPVYYRDFRGKWTKDVGAEIDLTVKTDRVAGVALEGGASVFLPTESYAGRKDPDTGWWLYTMATVNF